MREHQHRGGGVDIEIEELDGSADQAGEQNATWRVGNGAGSGHRLRSGWAFRILAEPAAHM